MQTYTEEAPPPSLALPSVTASGKLIWSWPDVARCSVSALITRRTAVNVAWSCVDGSHDEMAKVRIQQLDREDALQLVVSTWSTVAEAGATVVVVRTRTAATLSPFDRWRTIHTRFISPPGTAIPNGFCFANVTVFYLFLATGYTRPRRIYRSLHAITFLRSC